MKEMKHAGGVAYEYLALQVLNKRVRGLVLTHCGGRADQGVDLSGRWSLGGQEVGVVGQCKAHRRRLGPQTMREMQGVMEVPEALGWVLSASGFSREALGVADRAERGLLLWHLTKDGMVESIHLNAVAKRTFPTLQIGAKFSGQVTDDARLRRPVLLFDGEMVFE